MKGAQAVLAIARTTAKDGLRAPVTGVVLVASVALALLGPEIAVFTLGNARAFVLDLGVSTALLATVFLAAVTAAWGSAERFQDGTALVVLAKTAAPLEYLLGTFLGAGAVIALAGFLLGLAVLHTAIPAGPFSGWADAVALVLALGAGTRASLAGRGFQTTALLTLAVTGALALLARGGPVDPVLAGTAVVACALAALAGLAYSALGLALATRLPPALAATATLAAAILGAASEGLSTGSARAVQAVSFLVPDLALFSVADAAYSESGIPFAYVSGVAAWTLLYSLGAVFLGSLLLSSRELR